MADHSTIEWTEATINPSVGCTHVSPGCDNCYAARLASGRLAHQPLYAGLAANGRFTGEVRVAPERLEVALRWRKPRRIFLNSMSDLWHDAVDTDLIARAFAVMALTPRHTFQVLTKRPGRMRSLLSTENFRWQVGEAATEIIARTPTEHRRRIDPMVGWVPMGDLDQRVWLPPWPVPNVWLGVSVETQRWAGIRIPALLDTPAAVRFLSCEPLLGPVDLGRWLDPDRMCGCGGLCDSGERCPMWHNAKRLHWVIVGGESGPPAKDGPGIRPMHPDWARSLRDQCQAAGVPFHFKQWGDWAPTHARGLVLSASNTREVLVGQPLDDLGHRQIMRRVGKHAAGRELDGRTWDQFPTIGTAGEVRA